MARKKGSIKLNRSGAGYQDKAGNFYTVGQAESMFKSGTAFRSRGVKLTAWHKGGYRDSTGKHYTEAEATKMFYEGTGYKSDWKRGSKALEMPGPGRKEKVPNLKRVEGGFQNQYGVTFTPEQKKALENSVRRSNYAREKQLSKKYGNKNALQRYLSQENDFIISRQSRSLQGFKSMADYEAYMDKQASIQSGEYLNDRTRLYKANHMQALKNVFGDDAKDVIMKIRMMPVAEYREMIEKDIFLEVNFIYDPSEMQGKLNQIRKSLNMKEKEIPM